jgi:hypothetical protein
LALLANNKQAETGSLGSVVFRLKHATTQTNSSISLLKMMMIATLDSFFVEDVKPTEFRVS